MPLLPKLYFIIGQRRNHARRQSPVAQLNPLPYGYLYLYIVRIYSLLEFQCKSGVPSQTQGHILLALVGYGYILVKSMTIEGIYHFYRKVMRIIAIIILVPVTLIA